MSLEWFPPAEYHATIVVGTGGAEQTAATIAVVSVSLLSVPSESVSVVVTDAVLEIVVAAAAAVGLTTIVTVALAAALIVPKLHVTVFVPEQLPCEADDDTNV